MFIYNILDQIVDILIYYYSNIRCNNVNNIVYDFLKYHLTRVINEYKYRDDEILSINVSFNSLDDFTVNNLDNISIYYIKKYIANHINDTSSFRVYAPTENFSISLNVCPFEGLTIDSSFVISVCDCMMY